jgi:hypothetical protein
MPEHRSLVNSDNWGRVKVPTTVSVTPVITAAGIYAAGDALGGLLTFADAADSDYGSGVIEAFVVIDKDQEMDGLELHLFNQTFTATADNAAFDPSDADMANWIGFIEVVAGDYADFADNSAAILRNQNLPFNLVADGTSLFGQLVTRATPTYTATSDITVKLIIQQD